MIVEEFERRLLRVEKRRERALARVQALKDCGLSLSQLRKTPAGKDLARADATMAEIKTQLALAKSKDEAQQQTPLPPTVSKTPNSNSTSIPNASIPNSSIRNSSIRNSINSTSKGKERGYSGMQKAMSSAGGDSALSETVLRREKVKVRVVGYSISPASADDLKRILAWLKRDTTRAFRSVPTPSLPRSSPSPQAVPEPDAGLDVWAMRDLIGRSFYRAEMYVVSAPEYGPVGFAATESGIWAPALICIRRSHQGKDLARKLAFHLLDRSAGADEPAVIVCGPRFASPFWTTMGFVRLDSHSPAARKLDRDAKQRREQAASPSSPHLLSSSRSQSPASPSSSNLPPHSPSILPSISVSSSRSPSPGSSSAHHSVLPQSVQNKVREMNESHFLRSLMMDQQDGARTSDSPPSLSRLGLPPPMLVSASENKLIESVLAQGFDSDDEELLALSLSHSDDYDDGDDGDDVYDDDDDDNDSFVSSSFSTTSSVSELAWSSSTNAASSHSFVRVNSSLRASPSSPLFRPTDSIASLFRSRSRLAPSTDSGRQERRVTSPLGRAGSETRRVGKSGKGSGGKSSGKLGRMPTVSFAAPAGRRRKNKMGKEREKKKEIELAYYVFVHRPRINFIETSLMEIVDDGFALQMYDAGMECVGPRVVRTFTPRGSGYLLEEDVLLSVTESSACDMTIEVWIKGELVFSNDLETLAREFGMQVWGPVYRWRMVPKDIHDCGLSSQQRSEVGDWLAHPTIEIRRPGSIGR